MRGLRDQQKRTLKAERDGGAVQQRAALLRLKQDLSATLRSEFETVQNELQGEISETESQLKEVLEQLSESRLENQTLRRERDLAKQEVKLVEVVRKRLAYAAERVMALTAENKQLQKAHELAMQNAKGSLAFETSRRDREIERLRLEVIKLEQELKNYKTDANIAHIRVNHGKEEKRKSTMERSPAPTKRLSKVNPNANRDS